MKETDRDPDGASVAGSARSATAPDLPVIFRQTPVTSQPLLDLVTEFRGLMVNGGACTAEFDVDLDADRGPSRSTSRLAHVMRCPLANVLVRSSAFAAALPEVVGGGVAEDTGFAWLSSLQLDGSLGSALWRGGSYLSYSGRAADAKSLGAAVCVSLFGDRYDDVRVDYTTTYWSEWFHDVAYDYTWVITDRRWRRMTVLCVTDTD